MAPIALKVGRTHSRSPSEAGSASLKDSISRMFLSENRFTLFGNMRVPAGYFAGASRDTGMRTPSAGIQPQPPPLFGDCRGRHTPLHLLIAAGRRPFSERDGGQCMGDPERGNNFERYDRFLARARDHTALSLGHAKIKPSGSLGMT